MPTLPLRARGLLRCGLLLAASMVPSIAQVPQSQAERQNELRGVTETLRRSEAEQSRLKSEVAGLKGDRAKLNTELLKSADAVRQLETRIAVAETRLGEVTSNEAALRRSLEGRQDTIVEVLAALQRMGRRPPPAVVVRPEDMREAIRAAILLGYVLPEIRVEAERLVADLGELVRLRDAAAAEQRRLQTERDAIAAERARLTELVSMRQSQIDVSEKALVEERSRIEGLARQSQTLKDLIARAESDNEATLRALDQARKVPAAGNGGQDVAALQTEAFKDPARLAPRIAFADARGMLALPVTGVVDRKFGTPDGFGGQERGLTIAAAADSIVTAPSDGWVLFAGPWRSYGRVLILNAGGGYNFVLTGLQHTSVEIGQFILAGEPVGSMGQAAEKGPDGGRQTLPLYVELRKDNQPIDPTPWWAKTAGDRITPEKARG
jgi:septal ring factor EnvC (AmiA/AmiB activator)